MSDVRRLIALLSLVAMVLLVPSTVAAATQLVVQEVDTSKYPEVDVALLAPPEFAGEGGRAAFAVKENGETVKVVSSESPEDAGAVSVVLLLDTSGSMKGKPLADALAAASRFVVTMGPSDQVAIVGFGSRPYVISGFSSDQGALLRALSGAGATGETSMFDAVLLATRMLATQGDRQRDIVLLSDGGDTASSADHMEALSAVKAAKAPVFAVALKSPDTNPAVLATLSKRSSGRFTDVGDSSTLGDLYEGIAREIRNSYSVTYRSARPDTRDLEMDIDLTAGGWHGTAGTVVGNPDFADLGDSSAWRDPKQVSGFADPVKLYLAVGFIGLAAAGFAVAGVLALVREPNTLSQLTYYEQIREGPGIGGSIARGSEPAISVKVKGVVGYIAGRRGITPLLYEQLERAGLPLRPVEYMYGHVLAVVGLGAACQVLTGDLVISLVVVAIAIAGPLVALRVLIDRRTKAFEEQLPDVLNHLAGSLRSGWGLLQSVELLAREVGDPAASEFKRVQTEARLGLPVEEALEKMAARLGSADFTWAVAAINIQREVGGNLAEILDIVSSTMRERAELRRHIGALTAEGKLSAWILLALPFLVALVVRIIHPEYLSLLFTTSLGMTLTVGGLVLLLIGSVWLYRVVKVEV